ALPAVSAVRHLETLAGRARGPTRRHAGRDGGRPVGGAVRRRGLGHPGRALPCRAGADAVTNPAEVLDLARRRGVMIATAESCTGGLIAGRLRDVPGSSDAVDRGFVTYSNAAKVEMLGIRPETLEAHGAVSEEIAAEMASGALARSQAGVAVAVTGIAGPGGSERKPEGRVCLDRKSVV